MKRTLSQARSDVHGLSRLIRSVPDFISERVSPKRAEEQIKRSLDEREQKFLELVRARIYARQDNPYLRLLKIAGCEFSDLNTEVRHFGLEKTLERLALHGVYLTSEEFKGKKDVIRGSESFRVTPGSFENRASAVGYRSQSSGTTNNPVRSFVSLDLLAIRTPVTCVAFAAHDLFSCSHAMYDAILPGAGGINNLLIYARMGVITERWFARKIPTDDTLEGIYHWLTTHLVVRAAKRLRPGFPKPEFIAIAAVDRIVSWVADNRRKKQTCCITTAASNATRIARLASQIGVSLEGVKFIVTGEPYTEAKHEVIKKVGAIAVPRYAYGGSINIGFGCANPLYRDELHVNKHLVSLLPSPHARQTGGALVHPLLCTTLDSAFPRMLLNVESGDYASFTRRNCGCSLEKVGLNLHLYNVRSHEKLTGEGMNYFYGNLYDLFEGALPAEFGGGPGDYQLVEDEDERGQTRLTIIVHPYIGEIDESKLLERVRAAFSNSSRADRFMTGIWEDAGTFRLKREVPYASPRGKILPLHISTAKTNRQETTGIR